MDQPTKSMTILVSVILILITFCSFYFTSDSGKWQTAVAVTIIIGILYLFCYYLIPYNYQLTNEQLIIKGGWIIKKIKLTDIDQTTLVENNDAPIFRVMGMGGLFGYMGWFYNRRWGRFLLYGRRRTGTFVALKLKTGQAVLLTPDDTDGLFAALNE